LAPLLLPAASRLRLVGELWQQVAPLSGQRGSSITIAHYPEPHPGKIDERAEQEIALLKDLTNACRTLRSEMNISPAQKLPLLIQGDPARLTPFLPYLLALARLSEVVVVEGALPAAGAPVSIVREYRLMLKIEVNMSAERERLHRVVERERVDHEIGLVGERVFEGPEQLREVHAAAAAVADIANMNVRSRRLSMMIPVIAVGLRQRRIRELFVTASECCR